MRILLTNDDGIYAPGLGALYQELKKDFELIIVAPESERSAVGHAITLTRPLRVKSVQRNGGFYGYAVSGTPADCVKIGVQELLEEPPDMVLSGINLGSNVGVNVLYSGTVSAATEGAFLGVQSAAVSLDTRENPDFRFAARFCRELIKFITAHGLGDGTALNVNIPALPWDKIQGVAIARQGLSRHLERFERRVDPRGNIYYWLSGETPLENNDCEADAYHLKENRITLTPITYDLTSVKEIERLKAFPMPKFRELDSDRPKP